jgi:SAM-dependent methyltransferase
MSRVSAAFRRKKRSIDTAHLRDAFPGSASYWETRYAKGKTSGTGSYGDFATFKADVLNKFVADQGVQSVIEFGCGDGNQLGLAKYPSYLGFDVSKTAIDLCRSRFGCDASKRFLLLADYAGESAEMALSLDVIYHLVEDEVFESHLRKVFSASTKYVVIYSSDSDQIEEDKRSAHVRHRSFTRWVGENLSEWRLTARVPNAFPYKGDFRTGSFSDFHFFERSSHAGRTPG